MVQQHMLSVEDSKVTMATGSDATIHFNAATVVSAIAFHIVDEKLARSVTAESIRRTTERLAGRPFAPFIAKKCWIAMTNPQRLDWLLNVSGTLTVMGENDAVMLRARRTR